MTQTLDDLLQEQNVLRVMLGEPGEPVFLDLKPVVSPTTSVRRSLAGCRL
jgi:hypothetical protein